MHLSHPLICRGMNGLSGLFAVLACSMALAAAPMPPCLDGGQCAGAGQQGSNEQRILALLNGRSPHFRFNMPADPVTTREVTVMTAAQFNDEAAVAGTLIRVNTSFSGAVNINGDDIDVVMANGATITGNLTIGNLRYANRVRWTGGNVLGRLESPRVNDLLFDDFYLDAGRNFNYIGIGNTVARYAFINSTLAVSGWNGAQTENWTIFTLGGVPYFDFILANVKVLGDGFHVARIQRVTNLVVVDTVFSPAGTASGAGLRLHVDVTNAWIRDSWARNNFHLNRVNDGDSTPQVSNARFDNFDRYESLGTYAFTSPLNVPNSGTVVNSRLHSTAGAGDGTFTIGGGMITGVGNDRVGWDGVTVPDYSRVGAIR